MTNMTPATHIDGIEGGWIIRESEDGRAPDIVAPCSVDGAYEDVVCHMSGGPVHEVWNRSHLISGSPELLAAAKAVLGARCYEDLETALGLLRKAVAKSEGRTDGN